MNTPVSEDKQRVSFLLQYKGRLLNEAFCDQYFGKLKIDKMEGSVNTLTGITTAYVHHAKKLLSDQWFNAVKKHNKRFPEEQIEWVGVTAPDDLHHSEAYKSIKAQKDFEWKKNSCKERPLGKRKRASKHFKELAKRQKLNAIARASTETVVSKRVRQTGTGEARCIAAADGPGSESQILQLQQVGQTNASGSKLAHQKSDAYEFYVKKAKLQSDSETNEQKKQNVVRVAHMDGKTYLCVRDIARTLLDGPQAKSSTCNTLILRKNLRKFTCQLIFPGTNKHTQTGITLEGCVRLTMALKKGNARRVQSRFSSIVSHHFQDDAKQFACWLPYAVEEAYTDAHEDEPPPKYVYGAESAAFPGLVKIGCTYDLVKRMAHANVFNTMAPFHIVAQVSSMNAYRDEKMAHAFFASRRERGEFFRTTPEAVTAFFNTCIQPLYIQERGAIEN